MLTSGMSCCSVYSSSQLPPFFLSVFQGETTPFVWAGSFSGGGFLLTPNPAKPARLTHPDSTEWRIEATRLYTWGFPAVYIHT